MRNRWFHRPFFHSSAIGLEKEPTWLELFYDFIFVAAFIRLGSGLSENVSISGVITFTFIFISLWASWSAFTFYVNRYTVDDFVHRVLVFLQMFAVGGMALGGEMVFDGERANFAVSAGASFLIVAIMYVRSSIQVEEGRSFSRYWGLVFFLGGVGWLLSESFPRPISTAIALVSTLVVLLSPLHRRSAELSAKFPIDFQHLGQRYGLLTLIVLGESFVEVLSGVAGHDKGFDTYMQTGILLTITAGTWWIYFDDVAGAPLKKGHGRWLIWLFCHIPLQMSIVAVGVGIKGIAHVSWVEPLPETHRWLLAGFLAIVFFSVTAIDAVTKRQNVEIHDRTRLSVRWISGVLLLLVGAAGGAMSGLLFVSLVTAIVATQVGFDMITAPMQFHESVEVGKRPVSEVAVQSADPKRRRSDVSNTVRKGTPADLRTDLYYFFIEGSWFRIFAGFGAFFLLGNVFFATLFVLEPGSISGADRESFSDAFFFSVQTMSTIGYGAMSPATDYGNMLVTVEAGLSMIAVAIATGIVFSKASRPKSGVLFSDKMTVTTLNGKKVVVLRIGNARGNEIVDANMSLVVVRDSVTEEGVHLRRLHDLKLVRSNTPIFIMSWTVMHEIDEDSPLADVDWEHPEHTLISLVGTVMGHDSAYGQTSYARHVYYPDAIHVGYKFVDIIEQLDDGRLMIDYTKFHDLVHE